MLAWRAFVNVLLSVLGLIAVVAVAAVVVLVGSWHWAIAATILAAVALVIASAVWRKGGLFWAALVSIPGGVLCGMELGDYSTLRRGPILSVESPAQAAEHPEASGFKFDRAIVRADFKARYRYESRTRSSQPATVIYYTIAPIVTEQWTSGESVCVWAVCPRDDCVENWTEPSRAAIRAPSRKEEAYRSAVALAESTHGLTSCAKAAVLMWVASPEKAIEEQRRMFFMAVQFWIGFLLAGWLGYAVFRLFRRGSKHAHS